MQLIFFILFLISAMTFQVYSGIRNKIEARLSINLLTPTLTLTMSAHRRQHPSTFAVLQSFETGKYQ